MGVIDFGRESELGSEDLVRQLVAQTALPGESPPLCIRGAGDHDNPVKIRLSLSFVEQWDVNDQPAAVAGFLASPCEPARANGRMQDPLELTPFRFIVENERAQLGAVGISLWVTNDIAKSCDHRLADGGLVDE